MRLCHLVFFVAVIIVVPSHADVIHVNINAPDDGDGQSWATAYNDLQDAFAAAVPGDQIWVASGIYFPTSIDGRREATFSLTDNVSVYGGFSGQESDVTQADPVANRTMLSGDIDRTRVPEFDSSIADTFHVLTASGVTARVDGFHIVSGNAHQSPHKAYGGGVSVRKSRLTLTRCVVHRNKALRGAGLSSVDSEVQIEECCFQDNQALHHSLGRGGAIWATGSTLTIIDSLFTANSATIFGGAIATEGESHTTIRYCRLEYNRQLALNSGGGGAVWAFQSALTMGDTEVVGNTSAKGVAGVLVYFGDLVVADSLFEENHAIAEGGGLHVGNQTPGRVVRTSFINNSAFKGGGLQLHCTADDVFVENCTFHGNVATWEGGGVYSFISSPIINGCSFTGNQAAQTGGAVFARNGAARILNCSIVGNNAGLNGGGIKARLDGYPIVRNSILWNNTPDQIEVDQPGAVSVCFSIVENGWTPYGSSSVLDVDPLFMDVDGPDNVLGTPDDDLRLQPGSPAIDTGANPHVAADTLDLDRDGIVHEPVPVDADGNPRLSDDPASPDTGIGAEAVVDIGAFEFQGEPGDALIGDVDGDGAVSVTDLLELLAEWDSACECCIADLNADGAVDILDLLQLLGAWE